MPEEVIYHVEHHAETTFGFKRDYEQVQLPCNGLGYFAGTFPDGITSIKGVPVSAIVRVLLRTPIQGYGDGVVVATMRSGADGTWRIDGLHTHLRYDVVARYAGENDVIMSNVAPAIA